MKKLMILVSLLVATKVKQAKPHNTELPTTNLVKTEETTDQLTDFLEKLAFKESSGNKDTINSTNHIGLYQFSRVSLKDIGSNVKISDFKVYHSEIFTKTEQDSACVQLMRNNWHYMRHYKKYVGKKINGIEITVSGMLAACHLVGNGDLKKYLKSNGQFMPTDFNDTSVETYLTEFKGYDLSMTIK